MALADAKTISAPASSSRISGIDVARAMAMLGMVIAHYAWPDGSGSALDTVADAVRGRAMPLFIMLGGVGVTILTSRSPNPDRALLIRAAMLYPLGLLLQELTTFIAIILQSYALLFALSPGFRRLPSRALVGLTVIVAVAGSWTFQVVGPQLDRFEGPSDLLDNPVSALWWLLFNGRYPFFPVASFFLLGMVLGRLDLRSKSVAANLAGVGMVVGVGTVVATNWLIDGFPWIADEISAKQRIADFGSGQFRLARLVDTTGHSEMLAWVVSAAGTAVAVLGLSLLITPRLTGWARPIIALGRLALSFYVFQAVLVRFTPHPSETELSQEFTTALAIYVGFMVFATIWTLRLSVGPLEAALRLGSRGRRTAAVDRRRRTAAVDRCR
ncbi:MAG: acyltransferase family protein [Acidimicrobiales bacterium]